MNCLACNKTYYGNNELNIHYSRQPLCGYYVSNNQNLENKYDNNEILSFKENTNNYSIFEPCKDKLIHIIWNLLLIDKTTDITPELIKNNNIGYIIAILPEEKIYQENVKNIDIPHHTIEYGNSHEINITDNIKKQYEEQGKIIDKLSKGDRKNVFIFCNNGYQRSLPFICYYLIKYHPDEVPNLDKALDIILPQIDKTLYNEKDKYLRNIQKLNLF